MLYYLLVCYYAFLRPMARNDITGVQYILEIAFWVCNGGYILYELFEMWEKGPADYFNLGVKGSTNILDIILCVFWLTLFSLRAYFVFVYDGFDEFIPNEATGLQRFYIFIFGLQITLLTLRFLTLFSNTKYLGVLLKIVKLMCISILKFLQIYIIVIVGALFGLWFIVTTNACSPPDGVTHEEHFENNPELEDICNNYRVTTIPWGLIYIFEVFIGSGDLFGVGEQPMGILFMVAVTLFGTLILTNLLIALMTTEYEEVQKQAQAEVIFNETELTFDLTSRSRQMPPPLNVISTIVAFVIHILNFFFALIHPQILNIYAYIDYSTFEKFRKFHPWRFKVDWKKKGRVNLEDQTQRDKLKSHYHYDRADILHLYIFSNICFKTFSSASIPKKKRRQRSKSSTEKNMRNEHQHYQKQKKRKRENED